MKMNLLSRREREAVLTVIDWQWRGEGAESNFSHSTTTTVHNNHQPNGFLVHQQSNSLFESIQRATIDNNSLLIVVLDISLHLSIPSD
jgi:hypothetical protein